MPKINMQLLLEDWAVELAERNQRQQNAKPPEKTGKKVDDQKIKPYQFQKTHGESGKSGTGCTPEYSTYCSMKSRCYKKSCSEYHNYGGRGIKVCAYWLESYDNFLKDMGRKPSPLHSIDRIDNDGNYEPSNCRWATKLEQSSNRRSNTFLTLNGKTQTMIQWARELGLKSSTLCARMTDRGWSVEKALTTPLIIHRKI